MTRALRWLLPALCLSLTGCGVFGSKDDEVQPAELVEFAPRLKVEKRWSAALGGDPDLRLGLAPASNGARVYAASSKGTVYAFDALTGKRVWRVETRLPLTGGPGVGQNLVALGTSEGDVIVLAAENGATLWTVNVGSEVLSAPAIGGDKVVLRTGDGRLLALSVDDGSEQWEVAHRVQGLTLRGSAVPVIASDVVVSGFDDGTIAAVALADGTVGWESVLSERRGRTELARLADVDGRVAVVGEDVFVAGFQGSAALLSLVSGQPVWRQELSSHQAIGLDWNRVYISLENDHVVALDRATGVIAWRQEALSYRQISGPAVTRNGVVVGDFDGYLHWLDATDGSLLARARAGDGMILNAPLVVGENVYVQTTGGTLTALRAAAPGGR